MSQLLSSGPPANPSRLPFRSSKLLMSELGGTMRAPSSPLKGEKVKIRAGAPLATHPQPIRDDEVQGVTKRSWLPCSRAAPCRCQCPPPCRTHGVGSCLTASYAAKLQSTYFDLRRSENRLGEAIADLTAPKRGRA